MIGLFIKLMFVFAITDVALQTEWMADNKRFIHPVTIHEIPWYYAMGSHAMINGAGVWLVTGNVWLGVAESVSHFGIDYMKCQNITGPHLDFIFHVVCRIGYVLIFKLIGGI